MTDPIANVTNHNSKGQLPIQVLIDGTPPQEWSFHTFTIPDGDDRYVGVIAELVHSICISDTDSKGSTPSPVVHLLPSELLTVQDAVSFAQEAILALR